MSDTANVPEAGHHPLAISVRPRKSPEAAQELLVKSDDPAVLRSARHALELLSARVAQTEHATLQRLVDSIPLERSAATVEAEVRQAQMNAKARQHFLDTYQVLDATQVHRLSGSAANNVHATANRWREQGRVFAVTLDGRNYYPAFQFEHGEPKRIFRDLIALVGERRQGWSLALWLAAPNRWLSGKAPTEHLDRDPEAVIDSLRQDLTRIG